MLIKDYKDVYLMKERLNVLLVFILFNDVGLLVLSGEFFFVMFRVFIWIGNENWVNCLEVFFKFDRIWICINGDVMVEKFVSNVICVLNDFKILFEDEGDYSGLLFFLLLLLFIEEDEFLGFLVNDMLNKELKYLFKVSEFVKMVRIVEKINFDLLIKGVNFIKSLSEVNGLIRIMNDNYSFLLRIVKW